jgi:hypothetical protein
VLCRGLHNKNYLDLNSYGLSVVENCKFLINISRQLVLRAG